MCLGVLLGAALLALRPVGPIERLGRLGALPTRLIAAPLGTPGRLAIATRRPRDTGSDPETFRRENDASMALEAAVLRSAWPDVVELPAGCRPIPGEVDARSAAGGLSLDRLRVRVTEPERVRVGQPVVIGDVFIGRVLRVHMREKVFDAPGWGERLARLARLSSAPVAAPPDAIDVALITGPSERVGALVERDQEGRSCRLVAGGVVAGAEGVHLAVHTPERRSTRSGLAIVDEPGDFVGGEGRLAEGFHVGRLRSLEIERRQSGRGADAPTITRSVLGLEPLVDFAAGLNQVLVLAADEGVPGAGPPGPAPPAGGVREDGGWVRAPLLTASDLAPWRRTVRLACGSRQGIRRGAALADGVRLVGRVERVEANGSAAALLEDPGFRVLALAAPAGDPLATPFVMGELVGQGIGADGQVVLRYRPGPDARRRAEAWIAGRSEGANGLAVVLWTASGMAGVPRGLRIGRTFLSLAADADGADAPAVDLVLRETGSLRGALAVRTRAPRRSRADGEVAR